MTPLTLYPQEIIQLQKGEVLVVRPVEPQPPEDANSWIERNMYWNFWKADGSGKDWPGTEGAIRSPFGPVGSEFWIVENDGHIEREYPDLIAIHEGATCKRV